MISKRVRRAGERRVRQNEQGVERKTLCEKRVLRGSTIRAIRKRPGGMVPFPGESPPKFAYFLSGKIVFFGEK